MSMHHQVSANASPFIPKAQYQPHVVPLPGYNQPCINGYDSFVYQPMPQAPYYAPTFYNPIAFVPQPLFSSFYFMPPMRSQCLDNAVVSLRGSIRKQIEYYFSDENLNKPDHYLIRLMDDKGWVPVAAIAEFHRVKAMCKSVTFILESLLDSSVVEVQGNKLRRRGVWSRWIPSAKLAAESKRREWWKVSHEVKHIKLNL